jgi:hypothetical protein
LTAGSPNQPKKAKANTPTAFTGMPGGIVTRRNCDLEKAKEIAREFWKEERFSGTMKRIQIWDDKEKLFEHNEFKSKVK